MANDQREGALPRLILTPLALVCVAATAVYALTVLPGRAGPGPSLAIALGAQVLATAILAGWPRRPLVGLVAALGVATALTCAPGPVGRLVDLGAVPWIPVAVAWAVVAVLLGTPAATDLRIAAGAVVAYVVLVATLTHRGSLTDLLAVAAPVLGGISVGLGVRVRRGRADRAAADAARREADALRAANAERQRLADELHDDLGHVLTLIVLQANTLAAGVSNDVSAKVQAISELGNRGLAALRAALHLVTDPALTPSSEGPRSSRDDQLAALRGLCLDAGAAGQDVTFEIPADTPAIGPAAAAALERAAKEALTNARRHAPGARVRVDLAADTDAQRLVLTIANDRPNGNGRVVPNPVGGTGRGLTALARGVALLGGECRHAGTAAGGYVVSVSVPTTTAR